MQDCALESLFLFTLFSNSGKEATSSIQPQVQTYSGVAKGVLSREDWSKRKNWEQYLLSRNARPSIASPTKHDGKVKNISQVPLSAYICKVIGQSSLRQLSYSFRQSVPQNYSPPSMKHNGVVRGLSL